VSNDQRVAWVQRYCDLLQIEPQPPSLAALDLLVAAHVRRVPFENVSSILRRAAQPSGPVPALDPDALLEAWCERRAGGVCFEITLMVDRLLGGLGYRTWPVLAVIERLADPAAYCRLAADVLDLPALPIDRARQVLSAR